MTCKLRDTWPEFFLPGLDRPGRSRGFRQDGWKNLGTTSTSKNDNDGSSVDASPRLSDAHLLKQRQALELSTGSKRPSSWLAAKNLAAYEDIPNHEKKDFTLIGNSSTCTNDLHKETVTADAEQRHVQKNSAGD